MGVKIILPTYNYAQLVQPTMFLGSYDLLFPIENIRDSKLAKIFKGTILTGSDIDWDFGVGITKSIDGVAIFNHNFVDSFAGVLLNGALVVANLAAGAAVWSTAIPMPVRDFDGHVKGSFVDMRSTISDANRLVRAVRLHLPASATVPWIGEIWFGIVTELPKEFRQGITRRPSRPGTITHTTSHGAKIRRSRGVKYWAMVGDMILSKAQALTVQALWDRTRGDTRPIVLVESDVPYLVHWTDFYEYKQIDGDNYQVIFQFEEQSSGPALVEV